MVKLSRLVVNRFRNVRPGTTLKFKNGFNVLLGRNGSGKTMLLDLLSAVVTMDFSALKNETFDLKFDAQFDADEVEAHYTSARLADGSMQRTLELKLKPHADEADNLHVKVVDASMTIERGGTPIYDGPASFDPTRRPGMATLLDLVRQVATRGTLNQVRTLLSASRLARARRFDEGLDSFHGAFGDAGEIYLMPSEGTGPIGLSFSVPDWIIDTVAVRVATGAASPFVIDARESSSFAQVIPRLGGHVGEVVVEHVEEAGGGAHRFRCKQFLLKHANGDVVDHEHLSYGQKRLLALFWYFSASPHALVVDDLANGLDHSWLDLCLNEAGQRQTFLSASSPVLLERLRFDSGEDVRKTFTLCQREEHEGREELVWEQLNDKSAAAFYRAWKGGPGDTGEMLRSKGLW